jgi:hypothetical protein
MGTVEQDVFTYWSREITGDPRAILGDVFDWVQGNEQAVRSALKLD